MQTLTERLEVSEVTIRKDLTLLEEQGRLLRTHGGAVLAEDLDRLRTIRVRRDEHAAEKAAIARKARELVREEDTLFLDAGSTCAWLAREIRGMSLHVVTNSLEVMVELAEAPGIQLYALGGSFRREAGSFVGPVATEALGKFQIGTCFLGVTGISNDGRFSSQNTVEAQLKRQATESAARRVILADRSKYGVSAFSVFASAESIDILVTDRGFPEPGVISDLGIEVVLAD